MEATGQALLTQSKRKSAFKELIEKKEQAKRDSNKFMTISILKISKFYNGLNVGWD